MTFEFFDQTRDVYIRYGRLPHWDQAGATAFITWRTADSIPEAVLRRLKVERAVWLRRHGVDPLVAGWREQVRRLPRVARQDYHVPFTAGWMDQLDQCHGECVLRRGDLAEIVAGNLLHRDGADYLLAAFVVMPNHVQFADEGQLQRRCKAWKHYSAVHINRALGRKGEFWQRESFDHLVRSGEQFQYLRRYIASNPAEARLRQGEYRHYERAEPE